MTKTEKIKEIVKKYQKDSDRHFAEYQKQEKIARERLSEKAFMREFVVNEWSNFSGNAKGSADIAIREIDSIFDGIIEDFQHWVMEPLKPDILQTLTLIDQFGLKLSLTELKIIEKNIDSYFGFRIFSGLAKKAGFAVNTLDMDICAKEIESAKKNTENAIKMYAGKAPDFPGRDLLGTWTRNGIDYGEYQPFHLFYAANFLHDNGILDRLESILGKLRMPLEYTLTPEESKNLQNKIDGIVDPLGTIDKEKANKLLKEIPDVLSRLDSMQEDFPNKELAVKHFTLVGAGAEQKAKDDAMKDESKISVASGVAKEYSTRLGKVDEAALSQYK